MIDQKIIERAASAYGASNDCAVIGPDGRMSLKPELENAFEAGAKWMQEELFKNLWHTASEEPERNREIFAYGFYNTTIVRWYPDGYITWKGYCEKWRYTQWLYIDDLFPKEGGEQ